MTEEQLHQCAALVQRYRSVFGFVPLAVVQEAEKRNRLVVATNDDGTIAGWLRFGLHPTYATISIIVAANPQQGVGTKLLHMLEEKLNKHFQQPYSLVAKCPVDEPANHFYQKRGFVCIDRVAGRKRELNIWKKEITL